MAKKEDLHVFCEKGSVGIDINEFPEWHLHIQNKGFIRQLYDPWEGETGAKKINIDEDGNFSSQAI